jgi:hypothetical protein
MIRKRGQMFTDAFVFMIFALIILMVAGMYIYMGNTIETKLKQSMPQNQFSTNVTQVIDNTFGKVNEAYATLRWTTILLIIGMVISIFIGSYMVTTRPVFFVPYIFMVIIAVVVSVGISNAYQALIETPLLSSSYATLVGGNYFMVYLPIWITAIGFIGGIIMFARMKSQDTMVSPYG